MSLSERDTIIEALLAQDMERARALSPEQVLGVLKDALNELYWYEDDDALRRLLTMRQHVAEGVL